MDVDIDVEGAKQGVEVAEPRGYQVPVGAVDMGWEQLRFFGGHRGGVSSSTSLTSLALATGHEVCDDAETNCASGLRNTRRRDQRIRLRSRVNFREVLSSNVYRRSRLWMSLVSSQVHVFRGTTKDIDKCTSPSGSTTKPYTTRLGYKCKYRRPT